MFDDADVNVPVAAEGEFDGRVAPHGNGERVFRVRAGTLLAGGGPTSCR